jgi:hypothetical protein
LINFCVPCDDVGSTSNLQPPADRPSDSGRQYPRYTNGGWVSCTPCGPTASSAC